MSDERFVPWNPSRRNSPGWVITESGCHEWTGSRGSNGYGRVWDPDTKSNKAIHRLRYEREVGPIPGGMIMDHFVCSNPICCNPAHVRPVSHRENALRGDTIPARNIGTKRCPRGHPLKSENLAPAAKRKGWRSCRICDAKRKRCWERHATHRHRKCGRKPGHDGPHTAGKLVW